MTYTGRRVGDAVLLDGVDEERLAAIVTDLPHQVRARPDAEVREGGVGGGELAQGHFRHAERQRRDVGELLVETELLGGVGDAPHADVLGEPDGGHVEGLLEGLTHRHAPAILLV